jgi:peptide-methionine (R)-S-oxide reductase
METKQNIPSSEEDWKLELSPMQYNVLREKATEPPNFSESTEGELEYQLKKEYGSKFPKTGVYHCVGCNAPLYTALSKFDSGCGWPAFFEGVDGAIKEIPDADGRRVEIVCNHCNSHLGHVFRGEGFPTPTDERYALILPAFHCFECLQRFVQALREWGMSVIRSCGIKGPRCGI